MWFKKKRHNRRSGRGHVLNVKLRSDQVRATRVRVGAITFGLLFGTVFGLYVLWRLGEWSLNRLVYQNTAFAIQQVEVMTDGVIMSDQLRRWAGVKPGDNLFALDLVEVKRRLEMVPLIGTVSLERVFPRTLRIRVAERVAVAQVNVPRQSRHGGVELAVFHLDADGFVMQPLDPAQRSTALNATNDTLPLLSGVKLSELQLNRRVESPQARAALELLQAFDCSPMAGLVDLRQIDVGSPEVLVVTTGQSSEVTLGLHEFDRQLRRWREIHDYGMRIGRQLAALDLAVPNNIPARWQELAQVPVPPAKPPRPQSNRTRR
jgi:hypothetical protein